MLFAQTSTEAFETESAGSTSFTDNGVTFNIISHTSTFNIVNYPATGWSGTVNDNQYIDNSNSVGPSSPSFSIKTTSNLFKVNRFWVYVADKFTNLNATGSLTITGKLSGATKFTQTKTNNFVTSLGSTNGYTLIDLTNLNGQNYSNIVIDELQLTLGGNYYYLGLDAFTWVKDSNIVTTDSQSFITTWEVPNDNGSIKLYTDTNKYKYNYNVSWENIDDSDKKSKPLPNFKGDCVISNLPKGKYRVMITGDFPYFNVAKDFEDPNAKQLLTVEQWGTQLWKSMHKTFQSASNLIHIGKDIPNLTQVTDMSRMFDFAISFNGDLSKWDVSKVTDMQYIFSGASSFNGDLSKWNVSSLKNMQSMFHAAVAFDGDLSQWNVSSATNMIQVFAYAMSFNRDLSRWNVSNVTDMQSMFLGASSFNRDLSKWNVSRVIGPYGMLSMLEYSGMSVYNYDATLKGWANLSTINSNMILGATGLKYCTANTERDKLIKEKGWKINGDIKLGSEYILKDKSVVYDGKAHKLELELPHSFRGTYEIVDSSNNVVSDAINAGIYTVRAISECDQSVLHTATLTITPAVLTVTATPQSKVYGAVDPKLDYTISGLVNNDKQDDVLSGSLSREVGEDVGSYAITPGSLAANNNYILSFTGANLTIAPAVLIVSATAQSKVYGAADPSLSYAVYGLIEGDLLSGSLSREVGENVGNYAITLGSLAANNNYRLSFTGANLTIVPAVVTVSTTAQFKVYGAVDSKLDYTVSGLVNNDKVIDVLSGSLSRKVGEDVGSYAITQSDLKANGNYTLVFKGADLTITPAVLIVTVNPQSKVYGAVEPKLDYAVSGLVNNDKVIDVLSGSLSRKVGEDVGSYAITQSDLKANGNYTLVFKGADLTITPAVLIVTVNPQSKVYGAVEPKLDYAVSGLVNNDKETAVLSGSLSRALGEDVGTYAITQGTLIVNSNYSLSFIGANLTINRAPLTVSANPQSKIYGDVDPALDYAVSGLVNNDKEIDVLSGSLSRVVGEDVGSYAITQGDLKASGNYTLDFKGASLEITPAVLTVTVNTKSKVYGDADPSLNYTVSGLVNNDKETAVLSGSLSRAVGEDVGSYAITQGDLKANGNYTLDLKGASLEITPAVLIVSATAQSKIYGAVDPKLDYAVSGLVNNDKETDVLSGSLSRAVGEDVGSYAITQGDLKANGNYTLVFKGADLTIGKAPIIGMVLKGGTYVYDTKEKSVLLSSTLPIGTKVTYKNNKQTEAGEYEVTALIEGDNYIPLFLKTKLIINKAPQHIEFNALSPVLYDNLLQLQLIANSSVDLPINYTYMNVGTTVVATVTSTGLVKVLHPGSVIITAHQDGNNNYEPAQSVSQILVIKSDKAEINSLIINGRDIGELSSNKLFMLRCDEIDKQVEVELVTSEGASVNIGNHFFIDTPKAGIYNREIVVKSHSGTITNRYILSIERPFNFEDIVIQKFDNTLLVNNNPLTNGGYRFVGYKWFKNGKLIGKEQVYSVGNHRDDLLDIDALYSLELTTDKGEIIHSCPAMIKYTHTNSIKLYPNPVVKNGVMEIALDYPESSLKNIIGSVYSLTGQFLFKVSLENKISEVILPNTLVEGVYLMIIKIEGQNKVFRFMVKP
ncbi:hypothetical protein BK054_14430 [Myroides sp. ZB35]|nr:hypothetical protein BK054_14430 [Myroides sp. ZB35]